MNKEFLFWASFFYLTATTLGVLPPHVAVTVGGTLLILGLVMS